KHGRLRPYRLAIAPAKKQPEQALAQQRGTMTDFIQALDGTLADGFKEATDGSHPAFLFPCRERAREIGMEREDLVEACQFQHPVDALADSDEGQIATLFPGHLQAFDQASDTGAIDIADLGKIDQQALA